LRFVFGLILLALGTFITCINFYLSFIRYPLHRLRGRPREDYRFVSGFPAVGSGFLWFAAILLADHLRLMWAAIAISLLDTGGLHWFAGMMLYAAITRRGD
jgi:hypothetical protein